jgi:hypothetical protein
MSIKPNISSVRHGMLVSFNSGYWVILLVNGNIQPYGLRFVSSDIYKEDDCFRCDDNGQICTHISG